MKKAYSNKILPIISLIVLSKISYASPLYLECLLNGSITSAGKKVDGPLPEEMISLRIIDTKKDLNFNARNQNYLISLDIEKDKLNFKDEYIQTNIINESSQDLYNVSKFTKTMSSDNYIRLSLNRVTGQLIYFDRTDFKNEAFLSYSYSGRCQLAKRQTRKF